MGNGFSTPSMPRIALDIGAEFRFLELPIKEWKCEQLVSPRDFRILKLSKPDRIWWNGWTEPIDVQFVRASLENIHHDYMAISYCWEVSDDLALIELVDGFCLKVTRRVLDILIQIARDILDGQVSYVWIDAVCINQHDDIEKGKQVQIMQDIYASANRVIVWLGRWYSDSHRYLRFLLRGEYGNLDFWKEQRLFIDMIHDPWFERVWIV
jgi:hypothetical protein